MNVKRKTLNLEVGNQHQTDFGSHFTREMMLGMCLGVYYGDR